MKKSDFPKELEGKWIQPIRKGYGLACCDCGLVHKVDFRIVENGRGRFIQLRAFRDDKKTKELRKREGISIKEREIGK